MPVRLTAKDISRLMNAATIMLSPLDFATGESWVQSVCRALQEVVDADAASSALPAPGRPYLGGEPEVVDILQRTFPPPDFARRALTTERRARKLNVADWRELFDVSEVKRSAFYNDVVRPNRLLAPISMMLDVDHSDLPAAFSVYYEDEGKAAQKASDRVAKLQLLLPAFRAGVSAYTRREAKRSGAQALADCMSSGIAVFDIEGRAVFQNQALRQMLSVDRDPGLREAISHTGIVAGVVAARHASLEQLGACHRELSTRTSRYSITATFLNDGAIGETPHVAVVVEPRHGASANPKELASCFGFSRRELECALLLKKGASSKAIAATMGISVNTARRHVERILLKLNVHSRAAATAALHSASPPFHRS